MRDCYWPDPGAAPPPIHVLGHAPDAPLPAGVAAWRAQVGDAVADAVTCGQCGDSVLRHAVPRRLTNGRYYCWPCWQTLPYGPPPAADRCPACGRND